MLTKIKVYASYTVNIYKKISNRGTRARAPVLDPPLTLATKHLCFNHDLIWRGKLYAK